MKRTLKTEGLVLRKRPMPNQDKIITIFTKELGKVNVFAKGIKKITSRRLPHVQTANLINSVLYKKNDFFYLQESSLISGFTEIKKDPKKIKNLYLFFFVLERLLPENQPEPPVYNLTKKFLIELSKITKDNTVINTKFLNELLKLLGYSQEIKSFDDIRYIIEEIIHEKLPALDIM